uniref:Carbohydrate-binding module family 19 domain-containing protein n=1 Tax=viral metagenome TaxID=1070528 RepID=A0A6C0H6X2_9ZZZZ
MQDPPARHSKYSEYYTTNNLINYDLNSPLYVQPDFFTFPCKGFPKGPATQTITSNKVRVTLEGTATHGGGHCQFGISYNDRDFLVLRTVFSSCMLDGMSYEFYLPAETPSGDTTVFWTWINRIGNREYYMECADVRVENGNTNQDVNLPGKELIVANILNYPIIPEFMATGSYDGADLFSEQKSITINPRISNVVVNSKPIPTQSQSIPTPPPWRRPTRTLQTTQQCIPGYMRCEQDDSFSICSNGNWVNMACAEGTKCISNGNYILCGMENTQQCIPGYMKCEQDDSFSICSNGNWVNMACGEGTKCISNGNYILCA